MEKMEGTTYTEIERNLIMRERRVAALVAKDAVQRAGVQLDPRIATRRAALSMATQP